jgi:hypothetical protein
MHEYRSKQLEGREENKERKEKVGDDEKIKR